MKPFNLAILASGTGSNAINIINHFRDHDSIEVSMVLSNKADAPILEKAKKLNVNTLHFTNQQMESDDFLVDFMLDNKIDYIILAGYLRKIPVGLTVKFPEKIINIHPSLLPNYGGKGMYGDNVHKAVIANSEKETGITIHFVNENFDEGRIIAQFRCNIENGDLAFVKEQIHILEQSYFPIVIEKTILNKI